MSQLPTNQSLSSARLPVPDWDRPGETWRVEAENGWEPTADGICKHRGWRCDRTMAAWRPRDGWGLCAVHLRESRIWIENGQVVSWALRP